MTDKFLKNFQKAEEETSNFGLYPKMESVEQHVRCTQEQKVVKLAFQNNLFQEIDSKNFVNKSNYGSVKVLNSDSMKREEGSSKAYVTFELILDNKMTVVKRKQIEFS